MKAFLPAWLMAACLVCAGFNTRANAAASLTGSVVPTTEGSRFELQWSGQSSALYRIQTRDQLGASGSPWTTLDVVSAPDLPASVRWRSPEALQDQRFYRLVQVEGHIEAVEPAMAPPGEPVTLHLLGAGFSSNDVVRLAGAVIPGASILSSALMRVEVPPQPPGVARVELVRDGLVLSFFDVFFFDPGSDPFYALQGPPVLPPAAPVSDNRDEGCDDDKDALSAFAKGIIHESADATKKPKLIAPGGGQPTGELQYQETDLVIPGRGLDFAWTRTYRSRTGTDSPMGHGWTHSYDIRIQPGPNAANGSPSKIWCFDGAGRRDELARQTNGTYAAPGLFREGALSNDVFRLTFADAGYWEFLPLGTSPAAGRIARSVDRNGNTMRFEYDASGRLLRVMDTLDRTNTVAYNAADRIASVTDFSGRVSRYEYDSNGDLVACISPAVTGTPNRNDFPGGKTNRFTYTSSFADDRLNHNLTSFTDGKGQTWLQVVYQTNQSPDSVDFDAVAYTLRGVDKKDIWRGRVVPSPSNRFAVMRCIENDAVGNVTEYFYDSLHRLVLQREFTGRANPALPTTPTDNRPVARLRDTDPDFYETRLEYNRDSLCRRVVFPRGNSVECLWERDLNPGTSPLHAGNIRWTKHNSDDAFAVADATSLRTYYEHDPRFGTPEASDNVNVLGFVVNAVAGDKTPIIKGSALGEASVRIKWRRVLAVDAERRAGAFRLAGRKTDDDCDGFVTRVIDLRGSTTTATYDARGNCTAVRHHGWLPDGSDSPVVNLAYNSHGQLTALTNAADGNGFRRVDTCSYYTDGPQAGYLQACTVDATGLALTTSYEYDARGNVTRVTDARGIPTDFTVNALNQTVAKQTQGVDFGQRVRSEYHYDANNNLVLEQIENRDETGTLQPNSFFDITYGYDLLDRLVSVGQEISAGSNAVTQFEYDGNDNCTLVRSPLAVDGTQPDNVVQYLYDERNLIFREVRAPGTAAASTTQFDYNANRGRVRVFLAPDYLRVTTVAYDGFDRPVQITDPMGNVLTNRLDANGNVVSSTLLGELEDAPGGTGNRRLAETTYTYDSLDGLVRQVDSFFDIFTELNIGDGGSETTFVYAPNDQLLSTTDDLGRLTTFAYDTASRLVRATDAKSNVVAFAYDPNGNVVTLSVTNLSDVSPSQQVFVTQYEYDSLNRRVDSWENLTEGEVT